MACTGRRACDRGPGASALDGLGRARATALRAGRGTALRGVVAAVAHGAPLVSHLVPGLASGQWLATLDLAVAGLVRERGLLPGDLRCRLPRRPVRRAVRTDLAGLRPSRSAGSAARMERPATSHAALQRGAEPLSTLLGGDPVPRRVRQPAQPGSGLARGGRAASGSRGYADGGCDPGARERARDLLADRAPRLRRRCAGGAGGGPGGRLRRGLRCGSRAGSAAGRPTAGTVCRSGRRSGLRRAQRPAGPLDDAALRQRAGLHADRSWLGATFFRPRSVSGAASRGLAGGQTAGPGLRYQRGDERARAGSRYRRRRGPSRAESPRARNRSDQRYAARIGCRGVGHAADAVSPERATREATVEVCDGADPDQAARQSSGEAAARAGAGRSGGERDLRRDAAANGGSGADGRGAAALGLLSARCRSAGRASGSRGLPDASGARRRRCYLPRECAGRGLRGNAAAGAGWRRTRPADGSARAGD